MRKSHPSQARRCPELQALIENEPAFFLKKHNFFSIEQKYSISLNLP